MNILLGITFYHVDNVHYYTVHLYIYILYTHRAGVFTVMKCGVIVSTTFDNINMVPLRNSLFSHCSMLPHLLYTTSVYALSMALKSIAIIRVLLRNCLCMMQTGKIIYGREILKFE